MAPLVRTGGSRHTGLAALPHRNIQSDFAERWGSSDSIVCDKIYFFLCSLSFSIRFFHILSYFKQQKNPGNLTVPGHLTLGHNVPCGTQYILFTPQCSPRFCFATSRSGIRPINSPTNVLVWASSHRPLLYEFALLIANRRLLDNCSNTSWSYSTSTFTISDWRIAVCKWWFFVHFVGENTDFPLCPCGFWRFCYHSVIIITVH